MKETTLKSIKEKIESEEVKVKRTDRGRELFIESKYVDFLVSKSGIGFDLFVNDRFFENNDCYEKRNITGYEVIKTIKDIVEGYTSE